MSLSLPKRRITGTILSCLAAVAFGIVAGVATNAVSPQAAFAGQPGGNITVATVMNRAQWWMNTYGVVYSQNQADAKADGDGEKYRPDCSGFLSMVWHLAKESDGWDRSTNDLANFGDTSWLSSLDGLKQGDAILGVSYGHVALFDKWTDSSKTDMWVYEEYGSKLEGRHAIHAKSWYSSNGFRGLHYNKVVSDTWGTPSVYCQYRISGSTGERSGPGTNYTIEATLSSSTLVNAGSDHTVTAGGHTFRRLVSGRYGDSKLFVDAALMSKTSADCYTT